MDQQTELSGRELTQAISAATDEGFEKPELGVVDGSSRVAWIEGDSGQCEVARLRIAHDGKILMDRLLNRQDPANYGYEGCQVGYLRWWGDDLVAVALEEKLQTLWSVPLKGEARFLPITWPWAVHDDQAMWVDPWRHEGLVRCAALPSLESRTPMPFRALPWEDRWIALAIEGDALVVSHRDDGRADRRSERDRLRLPRAGQRSFPERADRYLPLVAAHLFSGEPTPSEQLLLEALAAPFCPDAVEKESEWLPFYWHRHLESEGRSDAAARYLAHLEEIGSALDPSEPEPGWRADWSWADGAVVLAARHVQRRARVLATACHRGLPGYPGGAFFEETRTRAGEVVMDPLAPDAVADMLGPRVRRALERLNG